MRHIKYFDSDVEKMNKEDFKKLINNKINWTFVNKLEYKLTKYQDRGLTTEISIYIKTYKIDTFKYLYKIRNSDVQFVYHGLYTTAISLLEKNDLFYGISIEDDREDNGGGNMSQETSEFIDSISDFAVRYNEFEYVIIPK